MNVESVLRMNPQNEPHSYARNSTHQMKVLLKAMSLVEERAVTSYVNASFPSHFTLADLGCSSGPNSILPISRIVLSITHFCSRTARSPPECLVFLNDLPGNDFNSLFTSSMTISPAPSNCFVSAMPGSFYGRLFPTNTLHFVHSSYSVHWLSQVPALPEKNESNIYIATTSPPSVFEAYLKQFQRDFTNFLSHRAQEVIPKGEMFLTLIGRSMPDPTSGSCSLIWWWLSRSLLEMADEGLLKHADIDSFNLPVYNPHMDELRDVVLEEGSFIISRVETFEMYCNPFYHEDEDDEKVKSGENFASTIRPLVEPMLKSHFGDELAMDDLFKRYARLMGEHLKTKHLIIAVSLTRK